MSGVMRDKGGVRWLDTRAMPWEEMPGLPGLRQKTLHRDADGEPSVTINFIPPGETLGELPYRHYHASVREWVYILEGEYPGWEYSSAEQTRGDLLWKRRHFFMERMPGSIHGVEAGATTSTGAIVLNWRAGGPGVWIGERNYEQESVRVPYGNGDVPSRPGPEEGGAVAYARGGVRWVDTRALDWEPMPGTPHILYKPLAWDEEGEALAYLVAIPPGRGLGAGRDRHRHYHRTTREFVYVLDGEYQGHEYESEEQQRGELQRKKKGYFMIREPGSIHGSESDAFSATGAIILNWRDGPSGIWRGERRYAEESVDVPFA
jgi:hypothetical protein